MNQINDSKKGVFMIGGFGSIDFRVYGSIDNSSMLNNLNEYIWGDDDQKWGVNLENDRLVFSGGGKIYNPTLYPFSHSICTFEDDDGNSFTKNSREMTDEDWEECLEEESFEVDFSEIVSRFSKSIHKGSIEMIMFEQDSDRSVVVDKLIVTHDGHGERSRMIFMEGKLFSDTRESI